MEPRGRSELSREGNYLEHLFAVEKATVEVTGGFHHRRPAAQLVREIVEDRTKDRQYQHRLMDYNNDRSTRLSDVRSLFAEAVARIR